MHGLVTDHHRQLSATLLAQHDALERDLERLEADIRERLAPYQELVDRLSEIPGFGPVTAWTVIAELGVDAKVFGTRSAPPVGAAYVPAIERAPVSGAMGARARGTGGFGGA